MLACVSLIFACFLTTNRALAYFQGYTYTYYLKDPDGSGKAWLTTSGGWEKWDGNWFYALYVRSDVNIMVHTYEFDCWWMDVSDWDYGINGYTQLRQWNTPWTHTEYLSTFNTTGDALFSSSVSKQGVPSGCQFYSVSNDAYNSFVVPHGTNYNNQDEAHSGTSYP